MGVTRIIARLKFGNISCWIIQLIWILAAVQGEWCLWTGLKINILPQLITLDLMAHLSGMIMGELLVFHSLAQELTSIHHCQTMSNFIKSLKPFYAGCRKKGTLATVGDTDEMQHYAAFHQGLHCLLRLKQPSGTEIHHNVYYSTCSVVPRVRHCGIPAILPPMSLKNAPSAGQRAHLENLLIIFRCFLLFPYLV